MKETSKGDARVSDGPALAHAPTYDLDTLLAMITPENLPLAQDLIEAAPVGEEAW